MRSFGRLPLMTVAVLGVVVLGRPVLAQDAIYNEAPTRDDFIGALSAPDAAPDLRTKGTTRGLSLRSAPETAPAAPTVPAATAPAAASAAPSAAPSAAAMQSPPAAAAVPRSINFKVEFALNSASLSDQAKATLDQLGSALSSDELAPYRFRIVGHTDASGSDALNLDLSERRARAVRDYLVSKFGIGATRLESVGVGATHLLRADDPFSGVNRRVEVSNLGRADG